MSKTLVIVESRPRARLSEDIWGKTMNYCVFGHVRDLPSSTMGVDVENNYNRYISLKAKKRSFVN